MQMLQRRTIVAAAAGLLCVALSPVRAADIVSPNDTARFLAGMPLAADSPLAPLTKDPAWEQHARTFDDAFGRVEQDQLARIRAWSSDNLPAARPTVFYMFSGPDFLYANSFYPKARTYLLAGLEPIRPVADLTTLRGSLAPDLAQLRTSFRTLLSLSYFITSQMGSDFWRGRLNGPLPVLYVFLARSGNAIREVTPVRLDEAGGLAPDVDAVRGIPARGVKITFAGSDGEARTLYYFSTNLANEGVKSSKFLQFCETLAPGDSFVKSASYLLHGSNFSMVRDFLLANSTVMIQDDSGIPLASYDPQRWDLRPFGHYVGPIGVFRGMYQRKYADLFKNSRPIDFGIGYRWRPNQSNLLLAEKKPGVSEASVRSAPAD
jgi:hypothetical protein